MRRDMPNQKIIRIHIFLIKGLNPQEKSVESEESVEPIVFFFSCFLMHVINANLGLSCIFHHYCLQYYLPER